MSAAPQYLDPRERELRKLVLGNFEKYALRLKIRTKSGGIVRFRMNRAQRHMHELVEQQLARTGRVRQVVVKARQHGSSTYVGARYFRRTTTRRGQRAFILTHQTQATQNLFEMVERFNANLPRLIRPHVGASNRRELYFDVLDSGYQVGTAGSQGVGRSATFQLFHGSEVAFWPKAEAHAEGALQAVPSEDSEVFLESTANGVGGFFHRSAVAAMAGQGDYELVFLPWTWAEDYVRPDTGRDYPQPWRDYASTHNLSAEQLAWAYAKNTELCNSTGGDPDAGPCWKFKQEYPMSATEAFQAGGDKQFIDSQLVEKARKTMVEGHGPTILGVDPARGGGDLTGVIDRQGRRAGTQVLERWDERDLQRSAARVANLIARVQPRLVVIDVTGVGAGLYDILNAQGFGPRLQGVSFGAEAQDPRRYANRRAEIWDRMREWFAGARELPVQIPDRDDLHTELCAPWWGPGQTRFVNERLQLEPKESIKERLGVSPDLGDALALTFAMPSSYYLADSAGEVRVDNTWDPLTGKPVREPHREPQVIVENSWDPLRGR